MNLDLRPFTSSKTPFKYESVTIKCSRTHVLDILFAHSESSTLHHFAQCLDQGAPQAFDSVEKQRPLIDQRERESGHLQRVTGPPMRAAWASCFCPKSQLQFGFYSHIAFSLSISQFLLFLLLLLFLPPLLCFSFASCHPSRPRDGKRALLLAAGTALIPLFLCSPFTPL